MNSQERETPNSGNSKTEDISTEQPKQRISIMAVLSGIFCFSAIIASILAGSLTQKYSTMLWNYFCFFGLVFGVGSLIAIAVRQKVLKGQSIVAWSFIALFAWSVIMIPALKNARACSRLVLCMTNLHRFGLKIDDYAKKHDDRLPTNSKWCDILSDSGGDIDLEIFTCPAMPNAKCSYAFNNNLDGLKLSDIPGDVVLLFETNGGWNISGGRELLSMNNHERRTCTILFADGTVEAVFKLDKLFNLRWQP